MTSKIKSTQASRAKKTPKANRGKPSGELVIKGAAKFGGALSTQSIKGFNGVGIVRLGDESRLELRDRLNVTRETFGRLVNVSVRTIASVEATAKPAAKLQRTYNEMYQLYQALGEVVDPSTLGNWFLTPNEALGGLKPLEVIERGDAARLWEMVYRLRSGMPG